MTKRTTLPDTRIETPKIIRSKKILNIVTFSVAVIKIPSNPFPNSLAFLFVVKVRIPAIGKASTPNIIDILDTATLRAYLPKHHTSPKKTSPNSIILTIPLNTLGLAKASVISLIVPFTSSFPLLYSTCK